MAAPTYLSSVSSARRQENLSHQSLFISGPHEFTVVLGAFFLTQALSE